MPSTVAGFRFIMVLSPFGIPALAMHGESTLSQVVKPVKWSASRPTFTLIYRKV